MYQAVHLLCQMLAFMNTLQRSVHQDSKSFDYVMSEKAVKDLYSLR